MWAAMRYHLFVTKSYIVGAEAESYPRDGERPFFGIWDFFSSCGSVYALVAYNMHLRTTAKPSPKLKSDEFFD